MSYNNVIGDVPTRYWVVTGLGTPVLGLNNGYLLVFGGTTPGGTIKSLRPRAGGVRYTAQAWGKDCASISPTLSGYTYAIQGVLEPAGTDRFTIHFKWPGGGAGELRGDVDGIVPITWQAEEGP